MRCVRIRNFFDKIKKGERRKAERCRSGEKKKKRKKKKKKKYSMEPEQYLRKAMFTRNGK